jgi:hypothetical protein
VKFSFALRIANTLLQSRNGTPYERQNLHTPRACVAHAHACVIYLARPVLRGFIVQHSSPARERVARVHSLFVIYTKIVRHEIPSMDVKIETRTHRGAFPSRFAPFFFIAGHNLRFSRARQSAR